MIKMVAGVYGLIIKREDGSTCVQGMGPESGPFSVDPKEEARLVGMKVAEYVGSAEPDGPSESMAVNELRKLGKELGLTFKFGITKAEMVKAIKAAMNAAEDDVVSGDENADDAVEEAAEAEEEAVEYAAEAEEEAPTFDAAEAVQ